MTRERAKEICNMIETYGIEVIKAYGEGKVIQHMNLDGEWVDCDMPIAFVNNHSFRVKSEETDHSDKHKKEKWDSREYTTTLQEHFNELLTTCKEKQNKIEELQKVCQDLSDKFDYQVKQVMKLEEENAELKEVHESDKRSLALIAKKGAELEKKISVLLSCKNCPENKGGYICQKEYEDKCLAQKIQYIKELQEENAELKEQIEALANVNIKAQNIIGEAKEIIRNLLRVTYGEGWNYSLDWKVKAEQFLGELKC